MNKTALHAII